MGCIGIVLLAIGFAVTVAAAAFPPLGILGIALMWMGWRMIVYVLHRTQI